MRVVVVGGGIAGASAAFHLASYDADVVLVDSSRPGIATRAGAGIICPWASSVTDPDFYRLGAAAATYYPDLVAELESTGLPTSFREVGALLLPGPQHDLDALQERVQARSADGGDFTVEQLDSAQARAFFPVLAADDGAVHISAGARVDGRQLRDALVAGARSRGVRVVDGDSDARLQRSGDRVTGALVGDEPIEADAVIVAAGCWSPQVLAATGTTVPIEPQRGQIMHFGVADDTSQWPVVLPDADHYLLSFDDSRIVAGATRETGSGYDPRLTAGGLHHVLRNALSVAPGLADAELRETRVGLRPMSPDGLPIAGPTGPDGLFVLTGLGPSGLTMGPYVGRQVARLVAGLEPETDLAACSPDRFR